MKVSKHNILFNYYNNQPNNSCFPYIPRKIVNNFIGIIVQKFLNTKGIISNESININNGKMYIGDYAYYGNYRLKKGKLQVKPIKFPYNYNLKKEWVDYYTLLDKLKNLPKIKFFNN